jgi:hypothetical protein
MKWYWWLLIIVVVVVGGVMIYTNTKGYKANHPKKVPCPAGQVRQADGTCK